MMSLLTPICKCNNTLKGFLLQYALAEYQVSLVDPWWDQTSLISAEAYQKRYDQVNELCHSNLAINLAMSGQWLDIMGYQDSRQESFWLANCKILAAVVSVISDLANDWSNNNYSSWHADVPAVYIFPSLSFRYRHTCLASSASSKPRPRMWEWAPANKNSMTMYFL